MDPTDTLQAMAEAQAVLQRLGEPEWAWTRDKLRGNWSYDARIARRLLKDGVHLVLMPPQDDRFHFPSAGLAFSEEPTAVVFYAKSRNGYATRSRKAKHWSYYRYRRFPTDAERAGGIYLTLDDCKERRP